MFVMEIECDVRKGEEGCKKNKRGNGCKLCERKLAFRAFRFGLVVGTKARECASESMSEAVHRAYSTICMARAASPVFTSYSRAASVCRSPAVNDLVSRIHLQRVAATPTEFLMWSVHGSRDS
jgi:hypothetical protein